MSRDNITCRDRRTVKNRYGDGSIRQRSPSTFQVRWYANGKRHEITVRGTYADARRALRAKLKSADDGAHVAPTKLTVAEHVRARLEQWKVAGDIGPNTHDDTAT